MDDNREKTAGRGGLLRRNWNELDVDCLVNVFGRIEMESLLLEVPFVCISWHKATLNPLCWRNLSFPEFLPLIPNKSLGLEQFYYNFVDKYQDEKETGFSIDAFVKMVVKRSRGKAVEMKLPGFLTEETLRYVSDECPALRVLSLPDDIVIFKQCRVIKELIGKWRMLEQLHLGGNLNNIGIFQTEMDRRRTCKLFAIGGYRPCETILDKILEQLGIHCKHFIGLRIAHACVNEVVASIIVNSLPNLRYLWTEESCFEGDSLAMLARGCKQLEVIDVTESRDFDYQNSLKLRRLLLRTHPRMSTGGIAPRRQLATR